MTDASARVIESLRDQCTGLGVSDLRAAALVSLIVRQAKAEGAKGVEITLGADGALHVGVDLEGLDGVS